MANIRAYAGVARAPFLLLPVTLVAAGAAAAAYDGGFSLTSTLIALVGLVALHVSVNSLNEASDMRTGIDLNTVRTPFSGGSGTLPAGLLDMRSALVLGWAGLAIGAVIGIWFVTRVGWSLIPILIIGAVAVVAYTDFFARSGVGEIAAGLGLGALPILGTALVQSGVIGPAAIAASIPAFFMTFNLLLLNEFPDEQADRTGGRRNLVLMTGRSTAAKIYAFAALAVPVSIIAAVLMRVWPLWAFAAVIPSLILLPKPLQWGFRDPQQPVPIPALGANVIWNLSTNVVIAIALGVAAMQKF